MLVSVYTVTWYELFYGLVMLCYQKTGADIAYSINEINKILTFSLAVL